MHVCLSNWPQVDTHVPRMAACLRDPSTVVRHQALALLGSLLQKVCSICLGDWLRAVPSVVHPAIAGAFIRSACSKHPSDFLLRPLSAFPPPMRVR
jgi:hypothetical protein